MRSGGRVEGERCDLGGIEHMAGDIDRILGWASQRVDDLFGLCSFHTVLQDLSIIFCPVFWYPESEGKAMNNHWDFIHEQSAQLTFDFFLQVFSHEGNGVKCGRDFERFQRIISKYQREAFLLREDKDNKCGEFDLGECNLERNRESAGCREGFGRGEGWSCREVGIQRICLLGLANGPTTKISSLELSSSASGRHRPSSTF